MMRYNLYISTIQKYNKITTQDSTNFEATWGTGADQSVDPQWIHQLSTTIYDFDSVDRGNEADTQET